MGSLYIDFYNLLKMSIVAHRSMQGCVDVAYRFFDSLRCICYNTR